MPDMQKLSQNKDKIISIIQSQGPSFPGRLSHQIGIPTLFVSALLAELSSEKRIKISNMKVGSSPLYFIQGQEELLENFTQYLNLKEREAFNNLKNSEILEDGKLPPAIRVALRNLKDFAHPINVRVSPEENPKLFWKFFSIPENQIKSKIQEILTEKQPETKPKPSLAPPAQAKQEASINTESEEIIKKDLSNRPKKKTIYKPSEFANSIRQYLIGKDIEILEILSEKKKEFISKIRLDEKFGKQTYYLIAKDKKKITTNDLTIALQQAQTIKMPALFLSPGELDKKAQEYIKEWKNLVKFERIKIQV